MSEHDWVRRQAGKVPVMVCLKCNLTWWPEQSKPTAPCQDEEGKPDA